MNNAPISLNPFEYLERWATVSPNAPFFRDGSQSITYGEALTHSRQLSAVMRKIGVLPGQLIGLELPVGLQVLFTCAVFHEAAVSFVHSRRKRLSSVTADWLFTTEPDTSDSKVIQVDAEFLRHSAAIADFDNPHNYDSAESLSRLTFSSGTTGAPKAVSMTLEMAHHRALAALELFEQQKPFLSLLDLSTSSGYHTFLGTLMTGQCYYNPGDAAHNLSVITNYGVTAVKASPIQLSELCQEARRQDKMLKQLGAVYAAGSISPVALRHALRELGVAKIVSLYGSTEAGRCSERVLDDDDLMNLGKVVEGTLLQIVDELGKEVPTGRHGFVRYKRAFQAVGYFNDSETTERIFRDGYFHTGDKGFISPSGDLILIGRDSEIVNAGGVKVNLSEIEHFAQAQPGVIDAAAFIYSDSSHVDQMALALESEHTCDVEALASGLTQQFGNLAPKVLVKLAKVPRNSAGKINRDELRSLYEATLEPN